MDPVAQQFVTELDESFTDLPDSVMSGLMMCGDDALPALVERLDDDRPPHQRRHAATVLGRMQAPEAVQPLVDAFAGGSVHPEVTRALGMALRSYGASIEAAAMPKIADETLLPQARMAFVSLLVAAGVSSEALDDAVVDLAGKAPRDALLVMKMQPKERWLEVLRGENRQLLMASNPRTYSEVLRTSLPKAKGVDAADAAKVQQMLAKQRDYAAKIAARLAARSNDDDDA